ncbi:MAG TPA: hypothetical protein PLE70_03860 [Methanolinea sp.]|nr:hypothetical protein [Methanolinea sp.]
MQIKNRGDNAILFSICEFIFAVHERVRQGTLEEFEEREREREREREMCSRPEHFGRIALRFSTWEARFNPKKTRTLFHGV